MNHTNFPGGSANVCMIFFVLFHVLFSQIWCDWFMWSWITNKNTFMITFNNCRRYWGEGVHTVRDRTKCQFTTSSTRPWDTHSISRDPRYVPLTVVYRFNFIIDDGIENTSFHYKSRFRVYQLRTTHRLLVCIRICQFVTAYVTRMYSMV